MRGSDRRGATFSPMSRSRTIAAWAHFSLPLIGPIV
jgi:hypothetical protein